MPPPPPPHLLNLAPLTRQSGFFFFFFIMSGLQSRPPPPPPPPWLATKLSTGWKWEKEGGNNYHHPSQWIMCTADLPKQPQKGRPGKRQYPYTQSYTTGYAADPTPVTALGTKSAHTMLASTQANSLCQLNSHRPKKLPSEVHTPWALNPNSTPCSKTSNPRPHPKTPT